MSIALVFSLTSNPSAARVRQELEEVLPQQQLAAAEDQEQRAGRGELVEDRLDFGGGHLAVVVVIEIAVDAALVAAVGEIELHRERNALRPARDPRPACIRALIGPFGADGHAVGDGSARRSRAAYRGRRER